MRRILAGIALPLVPFLLFFGVAIAQNNSTRNSSNFITTLGHCQFTASGTATTVGAATPTATTTCTVPARTAWAVICVETASIRWRDDGTAPTTAIGMPVTPSQCFYYNGAFSALSIIAQSGSPVVDVTYYDGPGAL